MTVTSNIYIGLSAWAATTAYSVGNRVSRVGNAYQVITAGTSGSSGPSGTASSITDGSVTWKYLSSVDYVSMAGWLGSIPSTLTQPIIGQLWNCGTITTTVGVAFFDIGGHTTTSTNTITLTCAPGESIRDSLAAGSALTFDATKGVSFTCPSSGVGGVNYLSFSDSNVIIDGIQVLDPNASSGSTLVNFQGDNSVMRNCLLDGYGQGGGAAILGGNIVSGTIVVANTLVVDRSPTGILGAAACGINYTTTKIVNTTLIGLNSPTASVGWDFQATGGTGTFRNNIVIGYVAATALHSNGQPVTTDHSLFSSASLTGTNITTGTGNLFSKTAANQFVSATVDFRLKSGADAIDVGVADSTDIPATDSISRTVRPQGSAWDMGAWEFLVAVTNFPRVVLID